MLDRIEAAIRGAGGQARDDLMRAVWTAWGAGEISDAGAERLSALAGERRTTPEPVRRDSHPRGCCESRVWQPTSRGEVQKLLLAARRYDLAGKQKGERNGPLGHVALEVLEYLVNLIDFRTGRLEPALTTIMDKVKRSRAAVVRALKALREHGFLDWLRRFEMTGNEGRGPQVRQVSNAYRLSLPEKALRLLGWFGKAPTPPDDHGVAQEARKAELDAYRQALPIDGRAMFDLGDTPLGRAIARLGKAIRERESAKQIES